MIVAGVAYGGLRAVSSEHLIGLRNGLDLVRSRNLSRIGAPACTSASDSLPADACVRRQLLFWGGYWPVRSPASVLSDSDNATAVRALQRDLGVGVDGAWGRDTQAALERALGGPVPESVPPGGWGAPRAGGGSPNLVRLPETAPAGGDFAMAGMGLVAVAIGGGLLWYFLRKKRR